MLNFPRDGYVFRVAPRLDYESPLTMSPNENVSKMGDCCHAWHRADTLVTLLPSSSYPKTVFVGYSLSVVLEMCSFRSLFEAWCSHDENWNASGVSTLTRNW